LIGRPWGPDGLYDADDQPCEATVHVTLDGEKGTGQVWIHDYEPECSHEWDTLTPAQQDLATRAAVEESVDAAMDLADAAYDTLEERDEARGW
jgi:hypothetical protein